MLNNDDIDSTDILEDTIFYGFNEPKKWINNKFKLSLKFNEIKTNFDGFKILNRYLNFREYFFDYMAEDNDFFFDFIFNKINNKNFYPYKNKYQFKDIILKIKIKNNIKIEDDINIIKKKTKDLFLFNIKNFIFNKISLNSIIYVSDKFYFKYINLLDDKYINLDFNKLSFSYLFNNDIIKRSLYFNFKYNNILFHYIRESLYHIFNEIIYFIEEEQQLEDQVLYVQNKIYINYKDILINNRKLFLNKIWNNKDYVYSYNLIVYKLYNELTFKNLLYIIKELFEKGNRDFDLKLKNAINHYSLTFIKSFNKHNHLISIVKDSYKIRNYYYPYIKAFEKYKYWYERERVTDFIFEHSFKFLLQVLDTAKLHKYNILDINESFVKYVDTTQLREYFEKVRFFQEEQRYIFLNDKVDEEIRYIISRPCMEFDEARTNYGLLYKNSFILNYFDELDDKLELKLYRFYEKSKFNDFGLLLYWYNKISELQNFRQYMEINYQDEFDDLYSFLFYTYDVSLDDIERNYTEDEINTALYSLSDFDCNRLKLKFLNECFDDIELIDYINEENHFDNQQELKTFIMHEYLNYLDLSLLKYQIIEEENINLNNSIEEDEIVAKFFSDFNYEEEIPFEDEEIPSIEISDESYIESEDLNSDSEIEDYVNYYIGKLNIYRALHKDSIKPEVINVPEIVENKNEYKLSASLSPLGKRFFGYFLNNNWNDHNYNQNRYEKFMYSWYKKKNNVWI